MSYKSKYRMYDAVHSGLDKGIQIGGQLGLQTLMSMNRRKEAEEEAARNAPIAAEKLRGMGLKNQLQEVELQNAPALAELNRQQAEANARIAKNQANIAEGTAEAVVNSTNAKAAADIYQNNLERLRRIDKLNEEQAKAQLAGDWKKVQLLGKKIALLDKEMAGSLPPADQNDYEAGMSNLKGDKDMRKNFQKAYLETRQKVDMTNRLLKAMSAVAQDESKLNKVKRLLGDNNLTFAGLINGLEQQGFKNLASELMVFSRGRLDAEPNAIKAQTAVAQMFQAGPLAGREAWLTAMNNLASTVKADISGQLQVVQSGFAPGSKRREKYSSANNLIKVPSFAEKYARDGRVLKGSGGGSLPPKKSYEGLDVRGVR